MLQRYCVNFDDDDLYATVYVERMVNELRQKRGCSQPLQCWQWQSQMFSPLRNLTFNVTFCAKGKCNAVALVLFYRGRTDFKLLIGRINGDNVPMISFTGDGSETAWLVDTVSAWTRDIAFPRWFNMIHMDTLKIGEHAETNNWTDAAAVDDDDNDGDDGDGDDDDHGRSEECSVSSSPHTFAVSLLVMSNPP